MSEELSEVERQVIEAGNRWIDNHKNDISDLLAELVSKPSLTGQEGTHENQESVVGTLWRYLSDFSAVNTDLMFDTQPIAPAEDTTEPRENIYAVLSGAGDAGFIATSHTDIVPPGNVAEWPDNDPFSMKQGTVRHHDNQDVVIEIDGHRYERTIREKMMRTWELRESNTVEALFGRGVYDNKASIVCLVASMLGLASVLDQYDSVLAGDLIHGHLVDEEVYQTGVKNMVGWGGADNWLGERYDDLSDFSAVVLEGSYGFVPVVGHRGLIWLTLSSTGKSAHASTPELGQNAVLGMARGLQSLDSPAFHQDLKELFVDNDFLGDLTVAPGTTIVGGGVDAVNHDTGTVDRSGVNTIPDWCESTFDIRIPRWQGFPDGVDTIQKKICDLVETYAGCETTDIGFEATIDEQGFFPPAAIADNESKSASHPLVQSAQHVTEDIFGYLPGIEVAPGVTDGAFLYHATRVPTLVEFGPAGALSHEPLEFVEREQVIEGAKAMLRLSIHQLGVRSDTVS